MTIGWDTGTGPLVPLLLLGHVALQAALVLRRAARPADQQRLLGPGAPTVAVRPDDLPHLPGRVGPLAVAALAGAALLTLLSVGLQAHEGARERSAPVVSGTVVAHPGDEGFTLTVELAGSGRRVDVEVYDDVDHPLASRTALWQLGPDDFRAVAEPYDGWGASTGAGVLAGLAAAALAARRSARHRAASFRTRPQPLLRARARLLPGVALVYPADGGPGTPPVVAVPLVWAGHPFEEAVDEDDDEEELLDDDWSGDLPDVVDVEVAGVPADGSWCTVRHEGAWLSPAGPALAADDGPPLVLPEPEVDGPVPVADLAPRDVAPLDGPVAAGGRHHLPWPLAWPFVLPALVISAVGLSWVGDLTGGFLPQPVSAGLVGLLALELAWRGTLRPRVGWDDRGFWSLGSWGGVEADPWSRVLAVQETPPGAVTVTVEGRDDLLVSAAGPRLPTVLRCGWRTGPQLRAVLLQARAGAVGPDRAPVVPDLRRPAALWLVWAVVVAVAVVVPG
ncbi:hypothetical protein [Kineococcus rubinsiae]|uniref:hypothetical protein n=1 Tax=Kineococcus rubinsiae TaxID=2609562 RepID=UPI001430A1EF|nr:hypothetical protein [Kineococcus rubinsiae]